MHSTDYISKFFALFHENNKIYFPIVAYGITYNWFLCWIVCHFIVCIIEVNILPHRKLCDMSCKFAATNKSWHLQSDDEKNSQYFTLRNIYLHLFASFMKTQYDWLNNAGINKLHTNALSDQRASTTLPFIEAMWAVTRRTVDGFNEASEREHMGKRLTIQFLLLFRNLIS